jgi:hypothetical protein
MGMKITQEYMDEYVVKPLNEMKKQIDELEKKINLAQITLNYLQKYTNIEEKKVK